MKRGLKLHLAVFAVVGSIVAFGCESVEQPKYSVADKKLKILPAHGLLGAEPIMSGLALDEDRIKQCKTFEQRRANEGKWPALVIPERAVELRSRPRNANIEEVDGAVIKYNFSVGDARSDGCFINAFHQNLDGTVTDYATGLIWKRKPSSAVSRSDADVYIRSLNESKYAGYSDWRIPTTEEMASLIDSYRSTKNSYIDSYFFRKLGVNYMTSDTYRYEGVDRVWIVNSFVRSVSISSRSDEPAHVLAVRSL